MHSKSKNYSQLQPEERVTLASLKQQNYSVRAMARALGRCASTISRELQRNSVQGHYASGKNWGQIPINADNFVENIALQFNLYVELQGIFFRGF